MRMVPDLPGSYEEIPPSLIDFAIRDRRWAQGNLQHSRVLFAHGLHWCSRVHMAMGIMAYVSALVWFLFLVIALSLTLQSIYTLPQYFPDGFSLFPKWPMQDSARSLELLILTLGVLLMKAPLPKWATITLPFAISGAVARNLLATYS